jgi:hypothetical protein
MRTVLKANNRKAFCLHLPGTNLLPIHTNREQSTCIRPGRLSLPAFVLYVPGLYFTQECETIGWFINVSTLSHSYYRLHGAEQTLRIQDQQTLVASLQCLRDL